MNNKSDKIIEAAQNVSLSASEKSAIKNNIADFVARNPHGTTEHVTPRRVKSFISIFSLDMRYAVPVFLLLLVFIGGGTTILAERSLPGDAFYPIKTNGLEKMQSVFTFNTKESALVDLQQATTRLSEVETLAISGKLTPAQDVEIQSNFSQKVLSLNTQISVLESKGDTTSAEEIKQKLDTELNVHEKILADASLTSSTTLGMLQVVRKARGHKNNDENDEGGLAILSQNEGSSSARTFAGTKQNTSTIVQKDEVENDKEGNGTNLSITSGLSLTSPATTSPTTMIFTLAQISIHNSATSSCYIAVKGVVYDITKLLGLYPGSANKGNWCGKDITPSVIDGGIPTTTVLEFGKYKIGILSK